MNANDFQMSLKRQVLRLTSCDWPIKVIEGYCHRFFKEFTNYHGMCLFYNYIMRTAGDYSGKNMNQ